MSGRPILAIAGATGAQGGGLVRAVLGDPERPFAARALTRKPDSAKAKELAALGAEVVGADLDDPESLKRAFRGAHGAFCVTNYWEYLSPEREQAQVRNMAEAAKDAGLKHVVWSTLDDTRLLVPLEDDRMPTLQGKYKVPHYDGKGEADAVFAAAGVPTTYLLTSFFWNNLIGFGMGPRPGPDGRLVFALPLQDKKLPGIASEDVGPCAYGTFRKGPETVGKRIGIAGGHLTGEQMAASVSKALGREVVYRPLSFDDYRALGFPGADDLGNMFQYKCEFEKEYCGSRDIDVSRALHPGLQTFDQWLARNGSRIPLE